MSGFYRSHRGSIKMQSTFPIHARLGIWMICMVAISAMVAAQTNFAPLRLNCGGSRYVDPVTKFVWLGDSSQFVTSGSKQCSCSSTIANTTSSMRAIYCCNRYFKPSVNSQHYTIPVLNTTTSYTIRLHFAELVRHFYSKSIVSSIDST